nr:uncharacterized protein LOC115269305 [Aedes albopictus]
MFRAYGSLPPSECPSPLSPTAPFLPSASTATTTTAAAEWMTTLPSSVVESTPALLGRSLSLFETVTASVEGGDSGQMFHQQQRRPELRRHWSTSSGERTTGTAGSGYDGGESGDDDGSVGLSNLLASARFFKTDRNNRGRIRGDAAKGFLNCNTNTLQSLAQLHGKLDFHEFIPGKQRKILLAPHKQVRTTHVFCLTFSEKQTGNIKREVFSV